MTKALFLLFCLFSVTGFAQVKPQHNNLQVSKTLNEVPKAVDSADFYISKLDCNSAVVTSTYVEQLLLDSVGRWLVESRDPCLDNKLLSHFDDTSKALALHIILTKRRDYDKSGLNVEYVYDKDYKHVVCVKFSCNSFHWYYLVVDGNPNCFFHIDKVEIEKAKLYWTAKLEKPG